MAYIPTIHTFEDDLNENKETDILNQSEVKSDVAIPVIPSGGILVPEKPETSIAKKILTLISVLFFLGALGVVGYYYYTNYQNKQAEAALNAQAAAQKAAEDARLNASVVNNLKAIFPSIADGISPYVNSVVKKDDIIIVTIKNNDGSGIDYYSQLYAYILAHQKDMGKDLVSTFDLNNLADNLSNTEGMIINSTTSSSTDMNIVSASTSKKLISKKKGSIKIQNASTSSSTLENVVNFFDPASLQNNFGTLVTNMTKQAPISGDNLVFESKTLNNQDFQIANAGVVTIIYGYAKQNYLVFSLSLKDFFDTIKSLQ